MEYPHVDFGVDFDTILDLPSSQPIATETYGSQPEQFSELWLPPGTGPFPVLVLVHGGCWLNDYDLRHVRPLATALSQAGRAVLSLEYRRIGDAGGGWPGTLEDVALGVDHLIDLNARLPLDLERVHLLGHSAGGHLALWAATHTERVRVVGVVGLAAISDLGTFAEGPSECQQAAAVLMGGSPADRPERYAHASPILQEPPAARVTLIHGSRDSIVSADQSERYAEAMRLKGKPIHVMHVEGAGHFDLIHPGSPAWPRLLEAIAP